MKRRKVLFLSSLVSISLFISPCAYSKQSWKEMLAEEVFRYAAQKSLQLIGDYVENKVNSSYTAKSEYKELENTYNLTPQKVVEIVSTWQYLKARNSYKLTTEGYYKVLSGKAYDDAVGAINWMNQNDAYWDIISKDFWVDSLYFIDSSTAEATFVIKEKADYYQNGRKNKKQSYSKSYKAKYIIKDYGSGDLKIVSMDVIK
jgi:hypothetical protein